MESIKETLQENIPKKNFFTYITDFDKESQNEVLNTIQYALLAIIPTIGLNKATQQLFPEVDEEKSDLTILAEIIGQLLFMIVGFLIIHKLVAYFPTLSKTEYKDLNMLTIVIVFTSLVLSLQTKIGGKTNILLDRLFDLWEGNNKKG